MATQQQPQTLNDLDPQTFDDSFFDQQEADESGQEDERAGASMPGFFWMNMRPDPETDEQHTGWHAKKGTWPDFDNAMEQLVTNGSARIVKVAHTDDAGNEITQEYWHLAKGARVFVISRGLQPTWKMNKHPEEGVGIAYGWPYDKQNDKNISNVKFQALLLALVKAGYTSPVTFGCKRTWTIDMLECLQAHQRVIDAANALLKSRGKPATIKYRHVALDLLQAAKWEWRPPKGTNERKQCYAIVTSIPKPPAPIEDQFVMSRYCGKEIREMVDALLPDAEAWSKTVGVLWRDGTVDDQSSSNGKHSQEREEDFNPFGPDESGYPEPEPEEQPMSGTATQDQRQDLVRFANTYRELGEAIKASRLRTLAKKSDLTDADATKAIQDASRETFQLQEKKKDAAKSAAPAGSKR